MSLIGNLLTPKAREKYARKNQHSKADMQREKQILKACSHALRKNNFTVENLTSSDGYLIPNDHCIRTFHIKECPGWAFGIWITPGWDDKDGGSGWDMLFNCFAQWEDAIDKFKPSTSWLAKDEKIYYDVEDDVSTWCADKLVGLVKYIHDEPYLAWYRDVYFADYNWQYITREEAKEKFELVQIQKAKREEIYKKQIAKERKVVKELLKENGFTDYKILDEGEGVFPRHIILVKDPTEKSGTFLQLCDWEEWNTKVTSISDGLRKKHSDIDYYEHETFENGVVVKEEYPDEQ